MPKKSFPINLSHGYLLFIIAVTIVGFLFAFLGIHDNHSFWADESYIGHIAAQASSGNISILQAIATPGAKYQPLFVMLLTLAFKLLGQNELIARSASIIAFTAGIPLAYLLGKKLSNNGGGMLAAILYTFSSINLSYATQARPYALLETLSLLFFYLISLSSKKRTIIYVSALIVVLVSTGTHMLGSLLFIPYTTFVILDNRTNIFTMRMVLLVFGIFLSLLLLNTQIPMHEYLERTRQLILFRYNHSTFVREILWKQYGFIILPVAIGMVSLLIKGDKTTLSFIIWATTTLFLWTFAKRDHNVRYLVPLFGMFFVYFGIFWSRVGDTLFNKKSTLLCLVIGAMLLLGGNKIHRKPLPYYSANLDLIGDVQSADYKAMYVRIYPIASQKDTAFISTTPDSHWWFLERKPTAYFMKQSIFSKIAKHPYDAVPIYQTVSDLIALKKNYKKGIIIIENWESIMPEEIKIYAKKNLHYAFSVNGLEPDVYNFSLSVYTWGIR